VDSAELEPEPVLHALQLSISQAALQTDTRLPQAIDREVNHIGHRATISDLSPGRPDMPR
jgi:hypothetical protein